MQQQKTCEIEYKFDGVLQDLVGPLTTSRAFVRLENISFLGILSQKFSNVTTRSIYNRPSVKRATKKPDGSRADHSIGVAEIAVKICRKIGLTEEQQKYAAAWGILHDLGNWPLSHTAQSAFSEQLSVGTKNLREWLIVGDPRAPKKYVATNSIIDAGLDVERLNNLFRKTPDKDLEIVSKIYKSKLTPDMLEGVWRSGRAFGIHKFDRDCLADAWQFDLAYECVLRDEYREHAVRFWKTKSEVYRRFFSSPSAVKLESSWSNAVRRYLKVNSFTIEQIFELSEAELVSSIVKRVSYDEQTSSRWKPPIKCTGRYNSLRTKSTTSKTMTLEYFDDIFIEEELDFVKN